MSSQHNFPWLEPMERFPFNKYRNVYWMIWKLTSSACGAKAPVWETQERNMSQNFEGFFFVTIGMNFIEFKLNSRPSTRIIFRNIFNLWQCDNATVRKLSKSSCNDIFTVILFIYIFVSDLSRDLQVSSKSFEKMSCFICDLVTSETYKIFDTITLYRGIPLYNVLYDFISKYFDVEIDDADIVCNTCNTLLDALNRFRCEFDNVERMLQSQITRKYKLKETQVCRLTKHFHKGTNKRFGCVECSFETDFVDCLMPHNWLHEHQTDFVNTSTASLVDHSFGTNICDNCNVDFSTSELLELHLLEFHADKVDSNPNSDTLSVQLESDGESENNDASFIDETVACDGRNHNPVNDNVLQCKVSW